MPDSVSSAAIKLHAGRAPVRVRVRSIYESFGGGRLLASGMTTGKRLMPLSFTILWTELVAFCSKYLRCMYAAGFMPGLRGVGRRVYRENSRIFSRNVQAASIRPPVSREFLSASLEFRSADARSLWGLGRDKTTFLPLGAGLRGSWLTGARALNKRIER